MAARLRVLSVEDSENDAELVRLHLLRAGWAVETVRVETAEEMTSALDAREWDVVIADYSLPMFDATRALGLLEARRLDIPVIVVSGTVGEVRAVELMRLGARDFVVKDDLTRLSPAIARELREADNRRLRRQAEHDRENLIEQLRHALDEAARLNLSLEEAHRSKDQFLATVSHELRTPLTAILGWARIATTTTMGGAREARAMQVIERNANAMTRLVEDLLDFSGASRGQLRLDVAPVDFLRVVDETLESARGWAQPKGVQIDKRFETESARVMGDAARLQQVVWNLVNNAVKFTPNGGRVTVALARSPRADARAAAQATGPRSIELTVSDTGQGITPDFLPFVFEPFRQADGTPTRAHGGLGLGLSIARYLVEVQGGTIEAHSDGTGNGARFVVRLPVAPANAAAAAERGERERGERGDRGEAAPPSR